LVGLFTAFLALLTQPVKLHPVGRDLETMFATDLFLQFLDLGIEELDVDPTRSADHVVVVLLVIFRFVLDPALAEIKFPGDPALVHVFQGPVDRGETHVGLFDPGSLEQFLR
jgi:hypothetical protein